MAKPLQKPKEFKPIAPSEKRLAATQKSVKNNFKKNKTAPLEEKKPKQSKKASPKINFKKNKANLKIIVGGIFLLLIVVFLGWLLTQQLVVKKINCRWNGEVCSPILLTELNENLIGQPLFFTKFRQKVSALPSLWGQVEQLDYQKVLPQTVEFDIKTVPLVYQLKVNGEIWSMNENNHFRTQTGLEWSELPGGLMSGEILLVEIDEATLAAQIQEKRAMPAFYHQIFLELRQQLQARPEVGRQLGKVIIDDQEKLVLSWWAQEPDYIFDQTDLDLSWQKFDYLQQNLSAVQRQLYTVIDLRFKLPTGILEKELNSTN